MTDKKNIQEVLNAYQPTPPKGGWEGVQSRMASQSGKDVDDVLSDYQAKPGGNHWKAINKRLVWNRFLTFRSGHFNIFYLAVVLLIISGSVVMSVNQEEEKQYNPEDIFLSDDVAEKPGRTELQSAGNKTAKNTSSGNSSPVLKKIPHIPQTQNRQESPTENISSPSSGNNTARGAATDKHALSENKKPDDNPVSKAPANSQAQEENIESFHAKIDIVYMPRLDLIALTKSLPAVQNHLEFRVSDTLGYNYKDEPIVKESPMTGISFSYAGMYHINTWEHIGDGDFLIPGSDVTQRMNENESAVYSHGLDLNFHYLEDHFAASTGIGIHQLNSDFTGEIPVTMVDTSETYQYYENGEYQYDTTWYLNLDTLFITGDSVFSPYVDSSYSSFTDSSLVQVYDTTREMRLVQQSNRIRYVNIPLWVGYREQGGRWEYQVQAGIIASIPTEHQYTWYDPGTGEFVYNSEAPFRKTVFTLAARTYIAGKINKHWMLGVEPAYYYRLGSLFDESYGLSAGQHIFSLGLRIQYQF